MPAIPGPGFKAAQSSGAAGLTSGQAIVTEVRKFLGHPYVYGAAGPSTFDCSGLVQYVLGKLGYRGVPRTSEAQWAWVHKVSRANLQPGDLVFAQFPGDNASPGHVGVYVGAGKVLSAEDPAHGVALADLNSWTGNIVGYGRAPGTATAGGDGGRGGVLGGLIGLPSQVTGFFGTAETAVQAATWWLNPENWMRIVAGLVGAGAIIAGVLIFTKAGAA